ncbi:MAG TPA: hypothetical protein VMG58_06140 [Candidatus Sulfotelmatobacter sp.]|nr:hypothetical protein [Candidatus Sulfotelmatobacter sp.]
MTFREIVLQFIATELDLGPGLLRSDAEVEPIDMMRLAGHFTTC